MDGEYNIKQHNKIGNFITNKTFHEMGIGFCQPNQTHKQVYRKQVHSGSC
jgi:hypothetical protein